MSFANISNSLMQNSYMLATIQMLISWLWVNGKLLSGMLFCNKIEWDTDICNSVGKYQKHHAKLEKPIIRGCSMSPFT